MSAAFDSVADLLDTIVQTVANPEHRVHLIPFLGAEAHDMDEDSLTGLLSRFIAADMVMGQLAKAPDASIVHLIGMTMASYVRDDFSRLGLEPGSEGYVGLVKYVNAVLDRSYDAPQSIH